MIRALLLSLSAAWLVSGAALAETSALDPALTVINAPSTGLTVFEAPALHGSGRPEASRLRAQITVKLPPAASIKRVGFPYWYNDNPVGLELSDGRCYEIHIHGQLAPVTCKPFLLEPNPKMPQPPFDGARYLGNVFGFGLWENPATHKTGLYRKDHPEKGPYLTTTMQVIGGAGMNSPDTPNLDWTLIGYVDGQLTIVSGHLYWGEDPTKP